MESITKIIKRQEILILDGDFQSAYELESLINETARINADNKSEMNKLLTKAQYTFAILFTFYIISRCVASFVFKV
jgi:hypothetical protein